MKEIQKKSIIATKRHLKNIDDFKKGKQVDYSYLDSCWICGKEFTFWDDITFNIRHSFEGNFHRRECLE